MGYDKHCKGEWYEMVCSSINDTLTINGQQLPTFPEDQIQISTTGRAGIETVCEAFIFYEDCMELFTQSGNLKKTDRKLMDFGVGWGRILRFFLKDFPGDQLFGVDIKTELLEICRDTFNFGSFIKSEALPPLDIESNSIDFIVAYSVFSHLSEEASLAWIKEFERILRPGGMLAVTTRGRWFFDYCESLKSNSGYKGASSMMFDDFDQARAKYDAGEFVHACGDGISGRGALNKSFYGESFIPETYIKNVYAKTLDFVEFKYQPARQTHPIIVLKKRLGT